MKKNHEEETIALQNQIANSVLTVKLDAPKSPRQGHGEHLGPVR